MKLLSLLTALLLSFPNSLASQQATSSPPASSTQATTILARSATVLTGTAALNDVTLTGTARRIVGADDESGTAVIKALAGTGVRVDFSFPSGNRSELRNASGADPVGSWSGPDGVSHPISNHNLFTDPGWFPVFTFSSLLSAQNALITYVGPETRNGQSVIHITASQQFPNDSTSLLQHLTQIDIFLDPNTNLPITVIFNTHPDNNALLDIPVEIHFSDYRSINSAQIPFHIQKFLNNSLLLDVQIQNAVTNSGLSASSFSVQ